MPTVTANGITISYLLHTPQTPQRHAKSPVVLINGLAESKETWAAQVPALTSAGYNVLAFDNRGIGASSAPAGPYTAALLAADTKALVSHLKMSRFHLVGVSMGGMVAQEYALAYPDDLLSMTLACTYAAPSPFCSRKFAMWAEAAQVRGIPIVMRDVMLSAFTPDFFAEPTRAAALEKATRNFQMSVPAYLAQLAVIQRFDSTNRLAGIKVPTMVLAGRKDVLIPFTLSKEMGGMMSKSSAKRWKTVKGGHACYRECPEPFNEAVVMWLDDMKRIYSIRRDE